MHSLLRSIVLAGLGSLLTSNSVLAQTYTSCNPLTSGSCPPNSALGRSVKVDLSSGASDSFTSQGNPTYGSDGAAFAVGKSGDSPQLISKWYIMFGHVEMVIKAAPGAGVVSSAVLQSDCLDEIDWEWLGGDNGQVQSNYFGKGQTTSYNRGAFHAAPGNHDGFKTYTIDWTAEQIVWQIDGVTVRALRAENAEAGQYPQTPMMVKVGSWSGGDSANAPGTIQWAGGPTDYSAGPYTMYLKSMAVTDYSTGTAYTYSGSAGTWESIKSEGGTINPKGGKTPNNAEAAPAVTSAASAAPIPFDGAGGDGSSTWQTPNVWPWVGSATATLQTSVVSQPLPSPSPSSPASLLPGPEVTTKFDDRGFPYVTTINAPKAGAVEDSSATGSGFMFPSAVPANDAIHIVRWHAAAAVFALAAFVVEL